MPHENSIVIRLADETMIADNVQYLASQTALPVDM